MDKFLIMFPNQLACKKKMLSRLRKCWEVEGEIVYSWNSQNSTKQLNCPIMEKLWYFVIICIEKKYGVLLLEYVQKIRGLFLFPVFFILEINLYMCKYGLANFWKVFYNSYVFFFFPHRNTFNCCIDNSDLPLRSTKKQW